MANYPIDNATIPEHSLNQIDFIVNELKRNPSSRRAVILIRDNSEDAYSNDPACLQHIQYFIRDNKLHCKVLFRSNDACKAAFMNMFALIMLQKRIANILNVKVGSYCHRANSYHCYERDFNLLKNYVDKIENRSDVTYSYSEDWLDIMNEYKSEISATVKSLKENI